MKTEACFVMDGSAVEVKARWVDSDALRAAAAAREQARREDSYRVVVTEFVSLPISTRDFDWCAVYGDYHRGPDVHPDPMRRLIGWGATERAAIDALHADRDRVEEERLLARAEDCYAPDI